MRTTIIALLIFALGAALASCSVSPADRQAITTAWAARDAERTAECLRNGGQYTAGGGCIFRGP
jgi:hypothetical protein